MSSSEETLCFVCRTKSRIEPLLQCPTCQRSYHGACWLLSSPTSSRSCPQCLSLCPRCWALLECDAVCPRCDVRYHKRCEKLLASFPGRQYCSLCIKELTQDRENIIAKYGHLETDGKRFYQVRLKSLSVLHLCYVPEGLCESVPMCEEFPPKVEVEKVLGWRENKGRREGLVQLRDRSESEATWEPAQAIEQFAPHLCAPAVPLSQSTPPVIEISSSSLSSPEPDSQPRLSLSYCAYVALCQFGYDLNDYERSAQHACRCLRVEAEGYSMKQLMQEMEKLLVFVCGHLEEDRTVYGEIEVEPRKVFFRNLEIAMMRKKVAWFHRTGELPLSSSRLYEDSFADIAPWNSRDDVLLLAAVLTVGYGNWKQLVDSLESLPKAREVASRLGLAQSLDSFIEARVRFLAYCLMLDEYDAVVQHSS